MASRHPIRSALWLVLSLTASAVCYLLLSASFAAAAQVVVYVGAIVVLVTFAIMLLKLKGDALDRRGRAPVAVAVGIGAGLLAALASAMKAVPATGTAAEGFGTVKEMGRTLMGPALLPFELTSLLLVAAMVAAVVLGRKKEA